MTVVTSDNPNSQVMPMCYSRSMLYMAAVRGLCTWTYMFWLDCYKLHRLHSILCNLSVWCQL